MNSCKILNSRSATKENLQKDSLLMAIFFWGIDRACNASKELKLYPSEFVLPIYQLQKNYKLKSIFPIRTRLTKLEKLNLFLYTGRKINYQEVGNSKTAQMKIYSFINNDFALIEYKGVSQQQILKYQTRIRESRVGLQKKSQQNHNKNFSKHAINQRKIEVAEIQKSPYVATELHK